GELVALAALGLAPPAHAQLDEQAARLRLPRRRPGRLHDRSAGRRVHRGLREGVRGARPGQHDGHRRAPRRRRVRRRDRPGDVAGGASIPSVPALGDGVPAGIEQRAPGGSTPDLPAYRSPADLPQGGVLVVGPSASGIQIAQEVHASGRPVTLAVGEHVRMPRTYRDRDVLWWMDATGLFDDRYDEIPDLLRARVLPSMQ